MKTLSRWCGLLTVAVLAGCGSDEPETKQLETRPLPQVAPQVTAPVQTSPLPRRRTGGKLPNLPEDGPEIAEADLPDLFRVADANEGNFDLLGPAQAKSEEIFDLQQPTAGNDSTMFQIASAPKPTENPLDASFKLPTGFQLIPAEGVSPAGRPWRIQCDKDKAIMALIPAGPFLQGSESGPAEVQPQLNAYVDGYYIDVKEVTIRQYMQYYDAMRAEGKKVLPDKPLNVDADPELPALGVPWVHARNYARWAGKELPTEAEWEKAARGPAGAEHPWGNGRAVWWRARTPAQIDIPGTFPEDKSPFGVFDMAGNAREYTQDWYSANAYQQLYGNGTETVRNSPGSKNSAANEHTVKGGHPQWKLWHRQGVNAKDTPKDVGFRCVLRNYELK